MPTASAVVRPAPPSSGEPVPDLPGGNPEFTRGGRLRAARATGARVWSRSILLRFAAVGAAAGLIDMGVVQGLVSGPGMNPYVARLFSYLIAASVAWVLNRRLTFGTGEPTERVREWTRYLAVNLGGAAVNYAVYAALVSANGFVARWPFTAVAVGSLTGMLVNFSLVKRWVFRSA